MPSLLKRTGLESVGGYTRLFLDFSSHLSSGLPPHLPGVSGDRRFWLDLVGRVQSASADEERDTRESMIEEMVTLSGRLGTRSDVLDKLRAAGRREAFFVIAGQQPGAFGGPLHTLYKALTAVALAAHLERITSRPFVPLYWCGGDDPDFPEIRGVSFLTRESTPISTAIPQQGHRTGLPSGSIGLDWVRPMWTNVRRFFDEFENGGWVVRVVEGAFEKAIDHGEHASAVLVGLAGGALAVVDGRSGAVRRHAQSVILDYVTHEDEVRRTITEQGEQLKQSGYHAQLAVGNDSGVFLLEDGLRKNVSPDLRPALIAAARDEVERCSPGVVARNLVQDFALKPVAVVLGPAEVAYRGQMSLLYPRFGLVAPAPVPRFTGTFVPPELAGILEGAETTAAQRMLEDPAEFVRSIWERALPSAIREAAREFEAQVGEAVGRFSRAVEEGAPPKAAGRVKARLSELKHRASLSAASASEIGRAIALDRWVFLSDLGAIIRPGGKPQERTFSGLVPYVFAGAAAREHLLGMVSTYLDDLLDGRASHIVYSAPS